MNQLLNNLKQIIKNKINTTNNMLDEKIIEI